MNLSNNQKEYIIDIVKNDFEVGHPMDFYEARDLFSDDDEFKSNMNLIDAAAKFYIELINLGPAGFIAEYPDLDYDTMFLEEYSDKTDHKELFESNKAGNRLSEGWDYDDELLEVPECLKNLPESLFDEEGNQLYNCGDELAMDWNERYTIEGFIRWFTQTFGEAPKKKDYRLLLAYYEKAKDNRVFRESIYRRGFKKSLDTSASIFGLIKDIKNYTSDMDKDEAVEEAVYAAVDYVKDGNL